MTFHPFFKILINSKNYFKRIKIAIPRSINKIPKTIRIIFKILVSPKFASGKLFNVLTVVELVVEDVEEVTAFEES